MLKELLDKGRYSFHQGFSTWEEAVAAACKPLLEEAVIEPAYIQAIIKGIKEYGPYIVIAPQICIPHAQEGQGVNQTAVCFMKTEETVHFSDDPEHDARLFFVLASTNNDLHMKNLMELVNLISDQEVVDKLLNAKTVEELQALVTV